MARQVASIEPGLVDRLTPGMGDRLEPRRIVETADSDIRRALAVGEADRDAAGVAEARSLIDALDGK